VVDGSVAALAGIRAGDEILRVNDASASDLVVKRR
jgi:S1-C subfamily serine protease